MAAFFRRIAAAVGFPLREKVGQDKFGNTYFVVRKRLDGATGTPLRGISWHDLRKKEERHVEWADGGSRCGDYSPEMLPPEWSQWLNFRHVEPPQSEPPTSPERLEVHVEARMMRAEQLAAGAPGAPAAPPAAVSAPVPAAADAQPMPARPAENSAITALRDAYKPGNWAGAVPRGRRRSRGAPAPTSGAQLPGADEAQPAGTGDRARSETS